MSKPIEAYLKITEAYSPVWLHDGAVAYADNGSGVDQLWIARDGKSERATDFSSAARPYAELGKHGQGHILDGR